MINTYPQGDGRIRANFEFDFDLDDVCHFAISRALDPDGGPPFHTSEGWIAALTRQRLARHLDIEVKELGAVRIDAWGQTHYDQCTFHAEGHWTGPDPKPNRCDVCGAPVGVYGGKTNLTRHPDCWR